MHPQKIIATMLIFASLTVTAAAEQNQKDPLERVNRAVLTFNLKADKYLLKPVAKAYDKVVPRAARNGTRNFFSNLWLPSTVLNDVLQGKWAHARRDSGRFVINSTLGLLGLMDVASAMDMPKRSEDFGQTLAVWGVPAGPYVMLPLLGPRNLRDFAGEVPEYFVTDPVTVLQSPDKHYATGLRLLSARARLLGTDDVLALQTDPYLFLREGYRQARLNLINDGAQDDEDELLDELLEDLDD